MAFLCIFFAFCALLKASSSSPLPTDNVEPVELSHTCMRIHSADEESANDNPVIFMHGLGGTKEVWSGVYQVIAMETGRKVCIVDLRNHGESPWSDDCDVEAMSIDIKHLLDKLEAKKAIVLGHSLGGKIAVHFTLNNPERVEKMIVEDMRPNGASKQGITQVAMFLRLILAAIKAIPENSTEEAAKLAVFEYIKGYLTMFNATHLIENIDPSMIPIRCSPEGKCTWMTNTKLFELIIEDPEGLLTPSSGLFEGPALFIYGKDSPFKVDEDEENIKKLFPNAQLFGVEGAGHTVHDTPQFMNTVIKFINSS